MQRVCVCETRTSYDKLIMGARESNHPVQKSIESYNFTHTETEVSAVKNVRAMISLR